VQLGRSAGPAKIGRPAKRKQIIIATIQHTSQFEANGSSRIADPTSRNSRILDLTPALCGRQTNMSLQDLTLHLRSGVNAGSNNCYAVPLRFTARVVVAYRIRAGSNDSIRRFRVMIEPCR